ncbi:MAG: HD family phosphohydrolase [Hormoscilla sp.]
MKTIQYLTGQVDRWWRVHFTEAPRSRQPVQKKLSSNYSQTGLNAGGKPKLTRGSGKKQAHPGAVLVVAVVSLTSTIGYRLYNAPKISSGTIAPETILAPQKAEIPDSQATEAKRQRERTGAIPVLMIDEVVNKQVYQKIEEILDRGNELRQQAGGFPFVEPKLLSLETQQYLRQAQEWEWRMVLLGVNKAPTEESPETGSPGNAISTKREQESAPLSGGEGANNSQAAPEDKISRTEQEQAIFELRSLKESLLESEKSEKFQALLDRIAQVRQSYALSLNSIKTQRSKDPETIYDEELLELSDATWNETVKGIQESTRRMMAQGIPKGLPDNLLAEAIALQLQDSVPESTASWARELLEQVVKANLIEDAEKTRLQAEQAALSVEAVVISVQKDEAIVEAGDRITREEFVVIDYFGLSQRQVNWKGLLGFGMLVSGAIGVFWVVQRKFHPRMRQRDMILVLLLSLSAPLLVVLNLDAASLPITGLLMGSFYGSALGVTVVSLLGLLLPIGMPIGPEIISLSDWLASVVGGILGGLMAERMRSREEFALLGVAVGLTQGVVYLTVTLIILAAAPVVWPPLLVAAGLRSLGGLACSIVALGLSPYLEHVFDLVTPVRLAELANPNRPLLQRLNSEAPGTFQHTLFVATLAEAATRVLGGNVELVRAGTLYHDIGKMHDPLGFIENQMGGPNKHDEIKDPWKSAEIIKKHVSEGLVMARKYRLPKSVEAFIPEHQGTMLIAYFYYQAKQMAEKDPNIVVRESDFRYDGPIPQSRETGILMLADSCEAALRSLKDATYQEALGMVNKILKARWQDNQLVDSGLTREEMPIVADVFVRVWEQFNHKRIAYPKGALNSSLCKDKDREPVRPK